MLHRLGGDTHVIAVCQPSVPVLAAVALMEADERSLRAALDDADGRPDRHPQQSDRGQQARRGARHRLVPPQRHHQGAVPASGRHARRLSGLPAAQRLREHEPRPPHRRAPQPVHASGQGRRRLGAEAPRVLRRVSRRHGPDRRVLSADRRDRVRPPRPAEGRDDPSRQAGRSRRRSAASRCSPSKARTTTSPASARPRRRTSSAPTFRPTRRRTTCSSASAITACSTARASAPRSRRASPTSCCRTTAAARARKRKAAGRRREPAVAIRCAIIAAIRDWTPPMSLRALAVPPPARTADDRDRVRRRDLSGARAPPPPGAALHAAHPGGDPRGRAHHAAARQRQGGASAFAQKQRRLDRGAAEPPAAGAFRSPTGSSCRCAACRIASCTGRARAARCGSRPATTAPLLCVAGDAPHLAAPRARFPQARGEARSRRGEPALRGDARRRRSSASSVRDQSSRWGSCSTTGVLSYSWRLILAPPYRARLSRRARGRASRRDEPLARGSGAWSSASARTGSAPKAGSTRTATRCTATARTARCRRTVRRRTTDYFGSALTATFTAALGLGDDAQGLRVELDAGEAQLGDRGIDLHARLRRAEIRERRLDALARIRGERLEIDPRILGERVLDVRDRGARRRAQAARRLPPTARRARCRSGAAPAARCRAPACPTHARRPRRRGRTSFSFRWP